jgi:hypothetical protein
MWDKRVNGWVPEMARLPSGLFVPASGRPVPRDATWSLSRKVLKVYILSEDVFDRRLPLEFARSVLRATDRGTAVRFAAYWLNRLERIGADRTVVDREFARAQFKGVPLQRVENLLRADRVLLVPQVLLMLTKLALAVSPERLGRNDNAESLPAAMLALASALSASSTIDATEGAMEAEIVANHHFNAPTDLGSAMAKFQARWFDIPKNNLRRDIEAEYRRVTGVELRVLAALCVFLWSYTQKGASAFAVDAVVEAFPEEDTIRRALALISVSAENARAAIIAQDAEAERIDWTFALFEARPVVDFGTELMVVSPRLLIQRILGWLPVWDVVDRLRDSGNVAGASSFKEAIERSSEIYARGVLDSMVPAAKHVAVRVYHEDAIMQALGGRKIKTADAVVDYGDRLVVAEISTRKLTRASVHGSRDALEHDIEALAQKARQIDSTIKRLRRRESVLTGRAHTGVQYLPILVMTENLPVNPVINSRSGQLLRMRSELQGADTARLEIVDVETLDAIEALQQAGGLTLPDLIASKQGSEYVQLSLHDYLIHAIGKTAPRPSRVQRLTDRLFENLGAVLRK